MTKIEELEQQLQVPITQLYLSNDAQYDDFIAKHHEEFVAQLPELEKAAKVFIQLGNICYEQGDYENALQRYLLAISLFTEYVTEGKEAGLQVEYSDEYYRTQGKSLRMNYHVAIENYKKNNPDISPKLKDILDRGVYCGAGSEESGILFAGINPSYKGENAHDLPCNTLLECDPNDTYWKPYVEIAKKYRKNFVGYIDLFPLRITEQKIFQSDRVVPRNLKARLLEIIMHAIEATAPSLIIYTNKTPFYWGTDEKHPWMGYRMIEVETDKALKAKGTLYKIVGITDKPDRIGGKDRYYYGALNGCYLFATSFQQYTKREEKLTYNDVNKLWYEYAYHNAKREERIKEAHLHIKNREEFAIKMSPVKHFPVLHYFGLDSFPLEEAQSQLEWAKNESQSAAYVEFLTKYIEAYQDVYGNEAGGGLTATDVELIEAVHDEIKMHMPSVQINQQNYAKDFCGWEYDDVPKIVSAFCSKDKSALERTTMKQLVINDISLSSAFLQLYRFYFDDIRECNNRIEILNGFKKVSHDIDAVISIIRTSSSGMQSLRRIMQRFDLIEMQAAAVLKLTLSELTGLNENTINEKLVKEDKLHAFLLRLQ